MLPSIVLHNLLCLLVLHTGHWLMQKKINKVSSLKNVLKRKLNRVLGVYVCLNIYIIMYKMCNKINIPGRIFLDIKSATVVSALIKNGKFIG